LADAMNKGHDFAVVEAAVRLISSICETAAKECTEKNLSKMLEIVCEIKKVEVTALKLLKENLNVFKSMLQGDDKSIMATATFEMMKQEDQLVECWLKGFGAMQPDDEIVTCEESAPACKTFAFKRGGKLKATLKAQWKFVNGCASLHSTEYRE
jgi:hypothetical protein